MLNIDNLEKCIKTAIENKFNYIGVAIKTNDNNGIEVIINPNCNFKNKLYYYKNAYTNDLFLKSSKGIRIINFTYGNNFEEIEKCLLETSFDEFI